MNQNLKKLQAIHICSKLGEHIRAIRKDKGLSVAEIAFKADIDSQNLRKYELGKQEMKVSMLLRIAKALDVEPKDLLDF
ncbi:helix-turn-helix domain-containing protein [Aquimarina agarilytica]|uniref:helix-turn-helix domain-containing protein n=1 Tax=Aquimarina agarilytica TaxID=1087449 RepID=UPI000289E056|nr:helix-turn-helix domain-containing protein [Aquimarina agarilytica]